MEVVGEVGDKSLSNEGIISVVGTFKALKYYGNEVEVGDIEDNGKGTIKWSATKDEQNEEAFETALKEYVSVSLENANASIVTSWDALVTYLQANYVSADAVL